MARAFCKRANRRGMFGDEYVSAGHPLFVAAADRLRHAERALSHHAQPPSTDATSTPPPPLAQFDFSSLWTRLQQHRGKRTHRRS